MPPAFTESRKPTLFQIRSFCKNDTVRGSRLLHLVLLWTPTRVERRLKYLYLALNHCQAWYTALQNWKGGRYSGKSCRPDISRSWSQPISTSDVLAQLWSCQTHSIIPHCQEMWKVDTQPKLKDYQSLLPTLNILSLIAQQHEALLLTLYMVSQDSNPRQIN